MMIMNTTPGIHPFQKALWDKFANGGFKRGEVALISAGRQTGKSNFLKSAYYKNLCEEILSTDMKPEPKYKFSRANWYEAKLPKDGQGAFNWCVKQFGPEPKNTDAWTRWYFNVDRTFRFRDAKDYEWFLLRWGI